ncbi:PepSY domain-containing protein [Psychrobacillus sp. FSL W7-1457]|uniref:PepSY domain-containing protein n=1 Tax=Psychrobacillus sp. FSL W7-1457 TaxID=2954547 RepID=UPI00315A29F1
MNKKSIFILIFYFLIASSCSFYFYNRTVAYAFAIPYLNLVFFPIITFLVLFSGVFILYLKDRQHLVFKMATIFMAIIVGMFILFELTSPNYTYDEAKEIVETEYNVKVVESDYKKVMDHDVGKEVYRITVLKDSQTLVYTFNPYSKEILFFK